MYTTTFNYKPIWAYGEAHQTCQVCQKRKTKSVREYATQNPFNKNDAGEICSLQEVRAQAKASVDRAIARIESADFTCAACIKAQAPEYTHVALTGEELDAAKEFCSGIEAEIKSLTKMLNDYMDEHLVGKDVMMGDRLAVIKQAWCDSEAMFLAAPYSRARYALPGETLDGDRSARTCYRLNNIELVNNG